MTSQPEVPGAAAVYLYKEETTDDSLHSWSVYVRLKVLTEKGKEYANVELGYGSHHEGGGTTVGDIAGRTIHPDGTIIPFTGKPYEKLIEKTQEYKYMAKVFTLPDVEVGSIIEYRYSRRWDDNYYIPPDWFIQSDLFLRKGHYVWRPTNTPLSGKHERISRGLAWFPLLPAGQSVKMTQLPGSALAEGQRIFELNVHDIAPMPEEEYMPPIGAFSYRVLFYYAYYNTFDEFWKTEGKDWAKDSDKFVGPGPKVGAAVASLTAPSDSQDQKLRKIYAAVMQLENTDFTREREHAEDKAQGLKEVRNTDDILERKRGSSNQLTELFVAMARAAGMKAYLMYVTDRNRSIFVQAYPDLGQLDDYVAIVNVDGKEQFFDPGSRYCPYGHLFWKHSQAGGIRQTDNGTTIGGTPGESYQWSRIERIGDLTMDEHGVVTGTVKMTYSGAPALNWRHQALAGDDASLRRELRTAVEHMLPGGMNVEVTSIEKLEDYEQPLVVKYSVKGPIGSSTGKRLLVPNDIFTTSEKPTFPHEKREVAVDMRYPYWSQDAVRITLPANIKVESSPAADKIMFQTFAGYTLNSTTNANSITVRRDFLMGEVLFYQKEYPDLRAFYNKFETKDQESIVLIAAPAVAPKPAQADATSKPGSN
ncbi:MAG TPA: DUF3857 domain-containing protein [Edaphobacter sp.]